LSGPFSLECAILTRGRSVLPQWLPGREVDTLLSAWRRVMRVAVAQRKQKVFACASVRRCNSALAARRERVGWAFAPNGVSGDAVRMVC